MNVPATSAKRQQRYVRARERKPKFKAGDMEQAMEENGTVPSLRCCPQPVSGLVLAHAHEVVQDNVSREMRREYEEKPDSTGNAVKNQKKSSTRNRLLLQTGRNVCSKNVRQVCTEKKERKGRQKKVLMKEESQHVSAAGEGKREPPNAKNPPVASVRKSRAAVRLRGRMRRENEYKVIGWSFCPETGLLRSRGARHSTPRTAPGM
jgi:hypothetical protein